MNEFKQSAGIDLFSISASFSAKSSRAASTTRSDSIDTSFSRDFNKAKDNVASLEYNSVSDRRSDNQSLQNHNSEFSKTKKTDRENTDSRNHLNNTGRTDEKQQSGDSKSDIDSESSVRKDEKGRSDKLQNPEETSYAGTNSGEEKIDESANRFLISEAAEAAEAAEVGLLVGSLSDNISEELIDIPSTMETDDKDRQAVQENTVIPTLLEVENSDVISEIAPVLASNISELRDATKLDNKQSHNKHILSQKLGSEGLQIHKLPEELETANKISVNIKSMPVESELGVDEFKLSPITAGKSSRNIPTKDKKEFELRQIELANTTNTANSESQLKSAKVESQSIQASQMQARALEQQAMQNLNNLVSSQIQDISPADKSVSDNMFHTMRGGIVTAPIVSRAESGSSAIVNAPVNTPILQPDGDKAMAANIRWMTSEGVKNAVVNVTPSGMGPISVSVGIENDHMTVSIVASQSATREALDSLIPRLREQLLSQGNESVRVDISDGKSEDTNNGFARQAASGEKGSDGKDETHDGQALSEGFVEKIADSQSDVSTLSQGVITIDDIRRVKSSYDLYV